MGKRSLFLVMVLLLLFGLAPARADAWPFTAQVCRTGSDFNLRIQVEDFPELVVDGQVIAPQAQHVGYALAWAPDDHWIWDDVWVEPGAPVEIPLDVAGALPNGLVVFHLDYGTFVLEFPLDDTTPACGASEGEGSGPPCDPSADENAVLVTFAAAAELLWAPDDAAGTGQWIQAGQTAWISDETNGYTSVVWSCDRLWVNSGAVGGETP